jgi:type IV conjugative transfer system protein TraL
MIIVFSWAKSSLITGFVVSAFFIGLVRYLRGDQGKGWFLGLCYWYLPGDFFVFLKGVPLSYKRFWLS